MSNLAPHPRNRRPQKTPDHESPPTSAASSQATASLAAYIADMCAELAKLAGQSELSMLAYFLNLARVEAEIRSREHGGVDITRRS